MWKGVQGSTIRPGESRSVLPCARPETRIGPTSDLQPNRSGHLLQELRRRRMTGEEEDLVTRRRLAEDLGRGAGAHGVEVDQHVVHRSEEHTSELQSRENLVCRLLLQ